MLITMTMALHMPYHRDLRFGEEADLDLIRFRYFGAEAQLYNNLFSARLI